MQQSPVSYSNPPTVWTHSSANASCCNLPGVWQAGQCFTSLPSAYIQCVMPPSTPSTSSTPFIRTAPAYITLCLRSAFRSLGGSRSSWSSGAKGRGANLHKTPAYFRCQPGIISTVNTHTVHMADKRGGTPALSPANKTRQEGNTRPADGINWQPCRKYSHLYNCCTFFSVPTIKLDVFYWKWMFLTNIKEHVVIKSFFLVTVTLIPVNTADSGQLG